MLKKRLVAVLILREGQVVQSVRFKHTNVIHYDPVHAVEAFNKWAVDEIAMINVTREASSREDFAQAVVKISRHCFVPLTVGGWIADEDYAQTLLRSGADKLVLNTALADHAFAALRPPVHCRVHGRKARAAERDCVCGPRPA